MSFFLNYHSALFAPWPPARDTWLDDPKNQQHLIEFISSCLGYEVWGSVSAVKCFGDTVILEAWLPSQTEIRLTANPSRKQVKVYIPSLYTELDLKASQTPWKRLRKIFW